MLSITCLTRDFVLKYFSSGVLLSENNYDNQDFKSAPTAHITHEGAVDRIVVCVVGEPNVGKSSLMNALLGVKKMAVSSHPGRTKHYQTYYLTPEVMLCDCPGLVFPKLDVVHAQQVSMRLLS